MTIEIRVPTLGESVTEATVARWLKQPGETITRDEPVVELETDKVTLEVPAPAAGTLGEIRAGEGTNVPVGAVLGIIADGAAGSARSAAITAGAAPHPGPLPVIPGSSPGRERESCMTFKPNSGTLSLGPASGFYPGLQLRSLSPPAGRGTG